MRKKALLRAAFSLTGITRVRWQLLPRRLYCFNFHRVGDPASTEYSRNVFSCTARRFEEYVVLLKERFAVVGLERLAHLDRERGDGGKPLALITFDDGYIDNYRAAFPILRRHGVPAAFFIPTGFVGSRRLPWWEEIPWILRQSGGKAIRLRGADEPFMLRADDGEQSIRRVMTFVKSRRIPVDEQLDEVRAACGGIRPPARGPGERLFVSWEEVREMAASGMGIGSHTHTHRLLGSLSRTEQETELRTSREILEAELRSPVNAVAYPVGSRSAYSAETLAVAAATGYRWGFNFRRRTNRLPLADPLDIGRLAVSENIDRGVLRSMICFPRLFAE